MKVINLLPPAEQRNLKLERINGYFRRFTVLVIFSFVVLIAVLIGWRLYLKSNLSNIGNDIAKAEALVSSQNNQKTKTEVEFNNSIVTDYNTFSAQNPDWATVLQTFATLVPKEVVLANFSANSKTGKIDITGTGLTRDAVLQLRNNILGSPLFRDVNLPLSNLQDPTNTPFVYTFYLAPNVLFKGANTGNPLATPVVTDPNAAAGGTNGN